MSQRPSGVVEPLPLVVLRAGQAPVRQGEPCAGLWRVQSGLLRASLVTEHGRELWLDVLGPGDVVGDHADVGSAWTVTALRPTRLLVRHPDDERDALARRTVRIASVAADLAWLDVPARIEHRLRELATRLGDPVPGGRSVPLALRNDDLAALAGTTRESANRAVRALIGSGRLEQPRRGRYVVRPALRSVGST
jgi:CRP-like cAMP-binding protein